MFTISLVGWCSRGVPTVVGNRHGKCHPLFSPGTATLEAAFCANRRLLAPAKDDLVAKPAWPVFKQTRHTRAHIFAFKEGWGHLVDDRIRRADASFQVGSHDLLAGGIRERGAARQSFGE